MNRNPPTNFVKSLKVCSGKRNCLILPKYVTEQHLMNRIMESPF